jgi:hypothetical protein
MQSNNFKNILQKNHQIYDNYKNDVFLFKLDTHLLLLSHRTLIRQYSDDNCTTIIKWLTQYNKDCSISYLISKSMPV